MCAKWIKYLKWWLTAYSAICLPVFVYYRLVYGGLERLGFDKK